jgi:23S rRNA-/tRNA-specific pseudouridylate synthase
MNVKAAVEGLQDPDLARIDDTLRTRYWCWIEHDGAQPSPSVETFLKERLPHINPASWPERAAFGGIYVNGYEATLDTPLPFPCKVEYYEPKFSIDQASTLFPPFLEEYLIYRDSYVAVVYKPPRLSSMPAKEQRHFSLKASLEKVLATSIHMPSRLDVSVQGLVVVSIHPQAHRGLQRAFELREVAKTYKLATAEPCSWENATVDAAIARHPSHPVLRRVSTTEGQSALTDFTVEARPTPPERPFTLVIARPLTGRTHQIRVHAAHLKIPIVGDNFYGGAESDVLHLVSHTVSFPHPITGAKVTVTLPDKLTPPWA